MSKKAERGPNFTEPTPKLPRALVHPERTIYPELRKNARGEIIMSYNVFCGVNRDQIEKMLEGQVDAMTRARGMKRIKN